MLIFALEQKLKVHWNGIQKTLLLSYYTSKSEQAENSLVLPKLCGYHYEDSEHFLLHCTALQETRINIIGLQQPFKESIAETISDFLLFKENSEEIINRNRDDLQRLSMDMATQSQSKNYT